MLYIAVKCGIDIERACLVNDRGAYPLRAYINYEGDDINRRDLSAWLKGAIKRARSLEDEWIEKKEMKKSSAEAAAEAEAVTQSEA